MVVHGADGGHVAGGSSREFIARSANVKSAHQSPRAGGHHVEQLQRLGNPALVSGGAGASAGGAAYRDLKEFPARQTPASFGVDRIMEQRQKPMPVIDQRRLVAEINGRHGLPKFDDDKTWFDPIVGLEGRARGHRASGGVRRGRYRRLRRRLRPHLGDWVAGVGYGFELFSGQAHVPPRGLSHAVPGPQGRGLRVGRHLQGAGDRTDNKISGVAGMNATRGGGRLKIWFGLVSCWRSPAARASGAA